MKRIVLAVATLLAATALWAATNPTQALVERISSGAQVCVSGQDCSADAMAAASTQVAARGGAEVYAAACSACHNTGAAGAPKIGTSVWEERFNSQDKETLISHAINGINAMPPKGGCSSCTDEEVVNAVEHILDESL